MGSGGSGTLSGCAVLLAAWGVVLCPAGDRARDIDVLDCSLKVSRPDVLLAQFRKPLPDLGQVLLVGCLTPAHALSKFRQLVQFLLHVTHTFIVMPTAVAMQGHDSQSLARRDSGSEVALRSRLQLESSLHYPARTRPIGT